MIATVAIMAAVAVIAIAVAIMQQRSRSGAPTTARSEPPTSLDRRDFGAPDAPWLIAVFTSATCASCAAVVDELRGYGDATVAVVEVEVGAEPALHKKYAIDSVPTAVIADHSGDAKLAFVGPLGPEHRAALATTLDLTS